MWILRKPTNHDVIYLILLATLITHINVDAIACSDVSACTGIAHDPGDEVYCFGGFCSATCNHLPTETSTGTDCTSIDPGFVCQALSSFNLLGMTQMAVCLPIETDPVHLCPFHPSECTCSSEDLSLCDLLQTSPMGWLAKGIGRHNIVCDDSLCTSQCDPSDPNKNPCPLFGMVCSDGDSPGFCRRLEEDSSECSLWNLHDCPCDPTNTENVCSKMQTAWSQLYGWSPDLERLGVEIQCNVNKCGMSCTVDEEGIDACNLVDYVCTNGYCEPEPGESTLFEGAANALPQDAGTSDVQSASSFNMDMYVGVAAGSDTYLSQSETHLELDISARICNVLNSGYTMEVGIGDLIKQAMFTTITTLTADSESEPPYCQSVDDIYVSAVIIDGLENVGDLMGDTMNVAPLDHSYHCPDLTELCPEGSDLPFVLSATIALYCGDAVELLSELQTAMESGELKYQFTETLVGISAALDSECLQGLEDAILLDNIQATIYKSDGSTIETDLYSDQSNVSRISHLMGIMVVFVVLSFVSL